MLEWSKNTYWKLLLVIIGGLILLLSILYSNYLAENLKINEEKNIRLYTEAIRQLAENANKMDNAYEDEIENSYRTFLETVRDSFPLPVIAEDETGALEGYNFGDDDKLSQDFLQKKKSDFLKNGGVPIVGSGYFTKIYCLNSPLLIYIKLFPIAQGLLVGLYIGLGYFLFSASRRSEQSRVWAGMAKETAHQLGTPISAIMGWIEYLKESIPADENDKIDIIAELTKDVNRLELVADRFSKIGSEPVLENADLYAVLLEAKEYLEARAPRNIIFQFEKPEQLIIVPINKHLFHWVIENLVRNSLDAMDGKGRIKCKCYILGDDAMIEVSDTGHGIPSSKFKAIFKPGYSTKKRGWGLGLSLANRIISQYHQGKIYVKSSRAHEETIFVISLPMHKRGS
jgi:nitrogen fixation/metabolism regulation signal transduction histidine kinase